MTHEGTSHDEALAPLHADDLPFYTVGQVSMLLDMQPAALRRLDDAGIVSPQRSGGGQRRYSRQDVERLREVTALTHEGLTLAGVRHVLELRQRVEELENEVSELKERLTAEEAEE